MIRQHEVGARAYHHALLDIVPTRLQPVEFLEERHRIEHHAVPQYAAYPGMQDARRDLVKDELVLTDANGVAGVGTALIASDPIGAVSEDVDDLTFPLVTPLRAHDNQAVGFTL